MPIKRAFILAAGKGTRMGEIGKHLPKVLWPLFDSTLLGLQIEYLRSIGVVDIALNSHHLHDQMCSYLGEKYPQVRVLHEVELLDAGGGVHNYLAHTNYSEATFLMNSDQYLELEANDLAELERKSLGARLCLLGMDNPGGFSGLKVKDDQLIDICGDEFPMYVGLSILNPLGLNAVEGASKFFSSVADYQRERITVHYSPGTYIDFGTVEHYAKTCFEILRRINTNTKQRDFFLAHRLISAEKINVDKNSYDSDQSQILNFTGKALQHTWPAGSVILKEGNVPAQKRAVVFGTIVAEY